MRTHMQQDGASLYALYPDGACERLGLSGAANTSLVNMLTAVVSGSNTPPVAALINGRLANLTSMTGAGGGAGGGSGQDQMAQQVLELRLNCTDVVMERQRDVDTLQRALYCGYYQARCNGTTTTQQ
jgi:hypothetical protein